MSDARYVLPESDAFYAAVLTLRRQGATVYRVDEQESEVNGRRLTREQVILFAEGKLALDQLDVA